MKKATMDQTQQDSRAVPTQLIEAAAKAVYAQWADWKGWVPWQDRGNSIRQDEARSIAREYLAAAPSLPESPQPPDVHLGRGDDEGASLASNQPPRSVAVCSVHDAACVEVPPSHRCTNCPEMDAAWNRRAPSVQPAVEVRKPLAHEQVADLWIGRKSIHDGQLMPQLWDFTRAIEAAHGISGEGE